MVYFPVVQWFVGPCHGYGMAYSVTKYLGRIYRIHQAWVPGVNDEHRGYVVPQT